ncbi:hypothetical protein HUK80_13025 [Flavobacterium sp. MAH-1]|uniref:Lipoprotein n=1 Tax=Flavobacterium agri TaxID=2743471 RepID=A0A7Y8Y3J4_9FLAO|nr:DUF6252 family protein [Flavobacterium agri]NUY81823.1 hypothetical protein [Flavobacterium agri]NYA71847.1 hypothetical protein [Flavobacterium agri]
MKKFKSIGKMAFLTLALCFAAACSSDDAGGSGGGSGSYLSSKVDGSNFKAEIMGQSTVVAVKNGNFYQVSGSNGDLKNIAIGLFNVTGEGTYEVGPDTDNVLSYLENNISYDTSNCSGATGTVTITNLTEEKIEGTFSFTGKDDENCSSSKTVTTGKFRGVFMQN